MNAQVETGWVKPPHEIGGLDHLGVQAPCIQIYGQMLPGITNVTDRARYYSFYPWLLNEFEKRGWRDRDVIVDKLRKADCLFSLISIRHARLHDDYPEHAGSAVGSNTLAPVVDELTDGDVLNLSDYTHLEDGKEGRYFKNPLGGFGQYYFGVLWELRLMAGDSVSSAKIIKETGVPLADAMALGVNGDDFFRALEKGEVSLSGLDELSSFCHCQLSNSMKESEMLVGVFRDGWPALIGKDTEEDTAEGKEASMARSRTLALFILMSGIASKQNTMFSISKFRGMAYTLCDLEGQTLEIPDSLAEAANSWQVYQRNEVLSIAMQGLFYALLRSAELSQKRFGTTAELSDWFWGEGPGVSVLENGGNTTFGELLNERKESLPAFGLWNEMGHEIQLMEQAVTLTNQSSVSNPELVSLTWNCMDMLAAVCEREENKAGYEPVVFRPGYLDPYPVNLSSVQSDVANILKQQSSATACRNLTRKYCLDSHLHVAMRKLRQQGQNTSRFEVSENGIVIKGIPPAAHTSPRFNQSMRILRDLKLLETRENLLIPSDSGEAFLGAVS